MTKTLSLKRAFTVVLLALLSTGGGFVKAESLPLYHYSFDASDGSNSGSGSEGTLAIQNGLQGKVGFVANAGVKGAGLSLNGQTFLSPNYSGVAHAVLPSFETLGTADRLTIMLWVKLQSAALTQYGRILVLNGVDCGDAESIGISLNGSSDGAPKLNVYINGAATPQSLNLGPALKPDVWYFIGLSYDGGTYLNDESSLQRQATNDSSINGQLYIGSPDGALQRFEIPVGPGGRGTLSRGPIAFKKEPKFYLGNRADLLRVLCGQIDEVRIYNEVLSAAAITEVFQQTSPTSH